MTFVPSMIRGARIRKEHAGQIDYRLARESLLRALKSSRISKAEVCDAHPELVRAARGVGEPTREICPVCETCPVVLVNYAFGAGLGPSGHCVSTRRELSRLRAQADELAFYVVEVCPECRWHHLARLFYLERRKKGKKS